MSFLHRSAHCSYGLHHVSCAYQRGPSWGWTARRPPPPFSFCQNWHGRILTVGYFFKVLLLCRFPPRFPRARTYRMYPCRTFLQNPTPVCRLFLPTSWVWCGGESCSILQGPFYWRRLIQGKAEGRYLVLSVVQQIYWAGYFRVFALRVSSHVSACLVRWWGKSTQENPPWLTQDARWLYSQLDLLRRRILLENEYPRNIVLRKWIFPVADVVTVP